MDLTRCTVKLDHSVGAVEPMTNWRQSVGFPVFGCGQPTEPGFQQIAGRLTKDKLIWFNLRQEPVAYIGGLPVAPRAEDSPHVNIEVQEQEVDALEVVPYHLLSVFSL